MKLYPNHESASKLVSESKLDIELFFEIIYHKSSFTLFLLLSSSKIQQQQQKSTSCRKLHCALTETEKNPQTDTFPLNYGPKRW